MAEGRQHCYNAQLQRQKKYEQPEMKTTTSEGTSSSYGPKWGGVSLACGPDNSLCTPHLPCQND
eukprot:4268526-Amphidinium_carterae.1